MAIEVWRILCGAIVAFPCCNVYRATACLSSPEVNGRIISNIGWRSQKKCLCTSGYVYSSQDSFYLLHIKSCRPDFQRFFLKLSSFLHIALQSLVNRGCWRSWIHNVFDRRFSWFANFEEVHFDRWMGIAGKFKIGKDSSFTCSFFYGPHLRID